AAPAWGDGGRSRPREDAGPAVWTRRRESSCCRPSPCTRSVCTYDRCPWGSYSVLMGEKTLLLTFRIPGGSRQHAGWVVGLPEGLDGGSEGSANNRSEPASASNTYVPRNGHGLHDSLHSSS